MSEQELSALEAILNTEPTEYQTRLASQFLGNHPYTTTALRAIAEVCLVEFDSEEMAQVLREAASKLASIEAKLI